MPVLAILGNPERGSVVTIEQRARLSKLLRGSRVVTCDASGHAPHEDEFDYFFESLRDFLQEVHSA